MTCILLHSILQNEAWMSQSTVCYGLDFCPWNLKACPPLPIWVKESLVYEQDTIILSLHYLWASGSLISQVSEESIVQKFVILLSISIYW